MAGSLLAEIGLPKLALAWTLLIGVPALVLGFAPLATAARLSTLSSKAATVVYGAGSLVLLGLVVLAGWFGGRRLLPVAERGFLGAQRARRAADLCGHPRSAAPFRRTDIAGQHAGQHSRCRARGHRRAGRHCDRVAGRLAGGTLWPFTRWK
ncbi:MAG: hypothetical protein MZV49_27320 [Rhodopseudomonas palustris]|nr:hypothetical protein [Rhodopseudomonas palustris]